MQFRKGGLILESRPYSYVVSDKFVDTICHCCFATPEKPLRCTNCKFTRYCNFKCQKEDWTAHHSTECSSLKRTLIYLYEGEAGTESFRLLGRSLRRLDREIRCSKPTIEVALNRTRDINCLLSHLKDMNKNPEKMKSVSLNLELLQKYFNPEGVGLINEQIVEMMGKLAVNSFSICDPEMNAIGSGLYLGGSSLDHSCKPNAVISFRGNLLQVRAIDDIIVNGVEEVFISYVDLLDHAGSRRKKLADNYYFNCCCEKCVAGDNVNVSGHKLELFKNDTCDLKLKLTTLKKSGEAKDIVKLCESFVSKYPEIVDSQNCDYVQIVDHCYEACTELQLWKKALHYGLKTLPGFEFFYGSCHPCFGIQLAKIGKLQLYLDSLDESQQNLSRALSIIRLTHGNGSEYYVKVEDLLQECILHRISANNRQLNNVSE